MRSKAITFLLFVYCTVGHAQSEQSNVLFTKGFALYEAGNFQEAAGVFEEAYSLDEAELDSLNGRRSSCRQWIASCYYKMGNEAKASEYDEFAYELPPIDRRLTVASDTLAPQIWPLFDANRLDEALALAQRVAELEINELGGETWYSLNSKSSIAYLLLFSSRGHEAVKLAEQNIKTARQLYGDKTRILVVLLRDAAYFYDATGDAVKLDLCYQELFTTLKALGVHTSKFAEPIYERASGFYAMLGNFEKLDALHSLQMHLTMTLYGAESVRRCNLLSSMSTQNLNLGRLELGYQQAVECEQLARKIDGKLGKAHISALVCKAMAETRTNRIKEARNDLKECLRHLQKTKDVESTASVLSSILMLQSAQGKKLDDDMLNNTMALLESMDQAAKYTPSYLSGTILLSEALYFSNHTHEAASIVNKNMHLYEQTNQFDYMFMACLVLMGDKQYVRARKTSSKGLEMLNRELSKEHAAIIVNKFKNVIDVSLKIVDRELAENMFSFSDTTTYSLNMIRQDLLQTRLAILNHEDSIGSEQFMKELTEFARTAILKTNDVVMADSIILLYSKKMYDNFGESSPQYQQVRDLKNKCEFERHGDGHLKAFMLDLHKDEQGTPAYQKLQNEYDEAYAAWKANGNKDIADTVSLTKMSWETYSPPYVGNIGEKVTFSSVADSCLLALKHCEGVLPAYNSKRDDYNPSYYIESLITTWCHCADSLEQEHQVVPMLKQWFKLFVGYEVNSKNNAFLFCLSNAWIYGRKQECLDWEEELQTSMKDSKLELHAAILMNALWLYTKRYIVKRDKCKALLTELDETLQTMKSQPTKDSLSYEKYFMLRSMSVWWNYWDYEIHRRSDLLNDFKEIYQMLLAHPILQSYRESYEAMNMLCDITTDYGSRDNNLTIQVDKMRKSVKKSCIAKMQERESSNWPSMSPLGIDFSLYLWDLQTYYQEKDIEELERDIAFAYSESKTKPNASAQEQYENLMASWNEIKELQKDAFSDNQQLLQKIEKLTTQVCEYLDYDDVSDTIRGLAYDITLFGKGYLLRSEQQLRKILLQSGNRTILQKYDEYLNLLQLVDNSAITSEESQALSTKARHMWWDLRIASKMFDDFTKSMETSWRDVQKALADDEVAIEYLCSGKSLKSYYALILRKGYDAPLVKNVGWEDRFTKEADTLYTIQGKYSSPWPSYVTLKGGTDIHPLEGVNRIYISPTGVLHQLSLESIRDLYTDSIMSDKYQIYRVSSTRELIGRKHEKPQIKAALYGGISYDLSTDEWNDLAQKKDNSRNLVAMRSAPILSRGAVKSVLTPLEGTIQEVNDINDMLLQQTVQVTCKMGSQATEDHLKTLSGSDVNVLHIATHGFYQSALSTDSTEVSFAREKESTEANALSRSVLFMAGASAVFNETSIPANVDDGVLTALEISHLDFTNINLVVLSACETALGDINGDGVFGLQRGFKKAGTQSILMSLWKVDDKATCLLMTEFYKNWIGEGKTKREALELAKQAVRSHTEKGWDDPKYWAAFILLDGLD